MGVRLRTHQNIVAVLAVALCASAGCKASVSAGSNAEPAEPSATDQPEAPGEDTEPEAAGEGGPQTGDPAEMRDPDQDAAALERDAGLVAKVKETFGDTCRPERMCGDILGVDCLAATDGPYHYVKSDSFETITTCGGVCRGRPCNDCPPTESGWDCKDY